MYTTGANLYQREGGIGDVFCGRGCLIVADSSFFPRLLFLRKDLSASEGNPVLLCLHGGIPDYFLKQNYHTGLED